MKLFGNKTSSSEHTSPFSLAAIVVSGAQNGNTIVKTISSIDKEVIYITTGHGQKKMAQKSIELSNDFKDNQSLVFIALIEKRLGSSMVISKDVFTLIDPHKSLNSENLACSGILVRKSFAENYLNFGLPVGSILMTIAEAAERKGKTYKFLLVN